MTEIPEHLLARAQKARERAEDEQYVQAVMSELKRIREGKDMTGTDKPAELQRSDNVTYYPGGPNTYPGTPVGTPVPQPNPPWVVPDIIRPQQQQRQRSFTEIYNMGLEISRQAATAFEEQTGQTIDQLVLAQLAVKIAQLLENW